MKDLLILCIPDKKGRYTMFPQCTCLFRLYGFSVPTTLIPAYSLLTPHRFVRLLFGKTSQNWCSPGVVPQIPLEIRSQFHRICALILHFTAQSASSWGCCKIRLCFRPTESNSIHEIGRFRWEQSNKLQHCPRKLYTVLVKTPFSGVLMVTRTAFGADGRT